jgi:hypothetical protein
MKDGYNHGGSAAGGGKMGSHVSSKNPHDRATSKDDLGVTFCDPVTGSPEKDGLGSSGPNQVPKGVPPMYGNRKSTGSSKI